MSNKILSYELEIVDIELDEIEDLDETLLIKYMV